MAEAERNQDQQVHGLSWAKIIATPYLNHLMRPPTTILLLTLLAIAIYSNTFSASSHFDDVRNIAENPWIKNLSNLRDLSGSRYMGFLSFALNYQFGRLNVFGYHLVNLLIHITNGVLVYLLVRLLFRASNTPPLTPHACLPDGQGQAGLTPAPWIALATALLFVAHPIQTQAVTYIVQRFTSLATLFYLLTVVCYLKWRLSPLTPHASRLTAPSLWYAGAFFSTLLAMKTKEVSFTLPFMLLLIEAVFFAPLLPAGRHGTRKSWIRLIPFLLTLPLIPLSRPGALGEGEAGFARQTLDISRWDYLLTQFRVILTYLRLLIFPVNQNLDYDYPVSHSLFDPPVFFSFLFLSALFALAIYLLLSSRLTPACRPPAGRAGTGRPHAFPSPPLTPSACLPPACRTGRDRRASRLTAFGILWFFLTLSIESSVIPIRDVIYEHRLYLPSVGFFLTACVAALGFSDRWRLWRAIGIGVIVAILSVVTYQRNTIWKDEATLWSDVVLKSPNKARPYLSLGAAYFMEQGMSDEAIQAYKTALSLKPDYAEAHNNLGLVYKSLRRLDEAIREYKTALSLKPDFAGAHNNLGLAYADLDRWDEAVQEYKTALSIEPGIAMIHNNLGQTLDKQGKISEAFVEVQKAVQLNSDDALAHYNLGALYRELGQYDKAVQQYKTATILNPAYAEAYNNLGLGYYVQGRLPEALIALKEVTRIKPDYVEAHNNLGVIYKEMGRPLEAIQEFQTAIKLKPDHVDAYYNLGNTYKRMGRIPEAIQAFEDALKIKPDFEKARQALKSLSQ